jgi:hypothetical protein
MSHIVRIETQVRDPAAVRSACARLKLPEPEEGTFQLFTNQATGLAVRLREWNYPVVCQTETGELAFDNYGGAWGDRARLDEFLQAYAIEKARLEARRQGHAVTEQQLASGAVKLTIHVGGAGA